MVILSLRAKKNSRQALTVANAHEFPTVKHSSKLRRENGIVCAVYVYGLSQASLSRELVLTGIALAVDDNVMNAREASSGAGGASLLSLSLHRLRRFAKPPKEPMEVAQGILQVGRNAEGIYPCKRAGFCIDADAFFRATAESLFRAQEQIVIVGWDTDSRTELPIPEGYDGPLDETSIERGSVRLLDLLNHLVNVRPKLNVYVLSWDFAFIYLFERESLPGVKFGTKASERVRFVLDHEHPTLASHHQKIVVVDDRVAFSGGLDLTQRRWDTPEHRGYDPRRVDPNGHSYGPFHDVQICVEGPIAKRLGDLVRERWFNATGETIAAPELTVDERKIDRFPPSVETSIRDIGVAISRTVPMGVGRESGRRPIQEVEKLFLDAIREAKRFVYIENQYFTSPVLAKAIAKRLREPNGPEFVMVLPRDQTGWIEESTMGLLRSQALRIVEKADLFDRFRCFYPVVPSLGAGYVKVHSKVMIVDDVFVRIGSANMNSRSMGLDTECDLTIEAPLDRVDLRLAISKLRRDLLGEHLGVDPIEFDARFIMTGSLVETVESFRGGERTLIDMRPTVPEWVAKVAPPGDWIDPTGPRGIRRWFSRKMRRSRHIIAGGLILFMALGLLLLTYLEMQGIFVVPFQMPNFKEIVTNAWEWSRSWNAEKIAASVETFRGEPWSWFAIILGFVVLSLVFVPVTGMIFGIAIAFPPWQALLLSLCGATSSGMALYTIGRYWAFSKSRILNKPIVRHISDRLAQGGVLAVLAVRLAPIAPFTVVGVVAGGLRVPIKNYLIGTVLGLLPGVTAITVISSNASEYATKGNIVGLAWALLALSIFVMVLPKLIARYKRRNA